MGFKFKKLFSMKTVKRLIPDLLPDLLDAIPKASEPELDLLLNILKGEIQRRIGEVHTPPLSATITTTYTHGPED